MLSRNLHLPESPALRTIANSCVWHPSRRLSVKRRGTSDLGRERTYTKGPDDFLLIKGMGMLPKGPLLDFPGPLAIPGREADDHRSMVIISSRNGRHCGRRGV